MQLPNFRRPHVCFLRCMSGVITQSNLLGSLPNGRTTIRHHQISHSLNNSCTPSSLGPARTLVTLRLCAAIFESIEPLLNLCYTHRIFFILQTSAESYELFCFENQQVFFLRKNDAVPLLNTFSHIEKIGNPTNTLCSTSLSDRQVATDALHVGDKIHTFA